MPIVSHVTLSDTASRSHATLFPATPAAVRRARHETVRLLDAWGHAPSSDLAQTAALLASELCTNAVRHAHVPGRGFRLTLRMRRSALRIAVTDAQPSRFPLRNPAPSDSGRGLVLLAALATAWGVDRGPLTKTVWCEIDPRA